MDSIAVFGFVADGATGAGLGGLRIEMWPAIGAGVVPLASARSEESGSFRLNVAAERLPEHSHSGFLEVELRVFDRGRLVASELRELAFGDGGRPLSIDLTVPAEDGEDAYRESDGDMPDEATAEGESEAEVWGRVRGPAPEGARVEALLRGLSEGQLEERVVADGVVNAAGWYRMKYPLPTGERRRSPGAAASADTRAAAKATLIVRLLRTDGELIGESAPLLSPPLRARMDIRPAHAPELPSEYQLLGERLQADVRGGVASLDGAEAEVIDEVADWLEVEPDRLELVQKARALEQETGVPAPIFYALGRGGLGIALEDLIDVPLAELRTTIEEAAADRIIDGALLSDLDTSLERLGSLIIDHALDPDRPGSRPGLGDILASAGLSPAMVRPVLERYQLRSGDGVDFWDGLMAGAGDGFSEGLDEQALEEMDLGVRLAGLVGPDPDVLRRVHQLRRDGRWRTLEDLTAFSAEDWSVLLQEVESSRAEVGSDSDTAGEAEVQERAASLAQDIVERFEEVFPSAFIRRSLAREEILSQEASRLLDRAVRYDLVADSIHSRIESEPELLEGLSPELAENAVEEIAAVERVSRVTERAQEVAVLVGSGMRSAMDIGAMPKRHFIDLYAEALGGRPQAARVHAQAQLRAAGSKLAAIRMLQARQHVPLVLGGAPEPGLKDLPDGRVLFGSSGLCGCDHCNSVYSPAAYLVDLLRYLSFGRPDRLEKLLEKMRQRNASPAAIASVRRSPPLDVLLARRPDLAHLPLTCENTNTALPYIDLVNELLEATIAGTSAAFDTGKTPADVLRAVPQNILRAAYEKLQQAVFPISLPYHQPLALARAYLGHLGVTRLELLQALARGRAGAREAILAESLGMSPEELSLVSTPPRELWQHFGFASESDGEGKRFSETLERVPAFLDATGITFQSLIDLLSTRFINGDNVMALASSAPDCSPDAMRMVGLDDTRLSRMLRLLRLQRRLGWKLIDLDRALSAFGATELDTAVLEKISDAREVARRLNRPLVELLVLWAPLDTWGKDNLFEQLLAGRSVMWRLKDVRTFHLRADRTELAEPGPSLDPVASALLAAFRITSEELAVVRSLQTRRGTEPRLDLAGLSSIYRVLVLARACGLRIQQLDFLLRLVPRTSDPFQPGSPAGTLRFVEVVREVQASEFSPERLAYLFRHESDPGRSPEPSPAQVETVLRNLRRALSDAFAETRSPTEIAGDTLRQKLALLLDAALLDPVLEALDPRSQMPAARRRDLFDRHLARLFSDPAAASARLFDVVAPGPQTSARALGAEPEPSLPAPSVAAPSPSPEPPPLAPGSEAVAAPASRPDDPLERRWRANTLLVLEHLLPDLRVRQLRGAVVQTLSDSLGLGAAATARLLDTVLRSRRHRGEPLLNDFLALLGTGLTGAYFANPDLRGDPVVQRIDAEVAFSWAGAAPADGVPASGWSARWTGHILPRSKAKHVFYLRTDGAVRMTLKIDGAERVLLDQPAPSTTERRDRIVEHASEAVLLDPGALYEIRIEYRNLQAPGTLSLQIGTGPSVKQLVATGDLYPMGGLSSFAPVQDGYRRLHKVAMILTGLGVTENELEWLTGEPAFLNLDVLPMQPPAAAAPQAAGTSTPSATAAADPDASGVALFLRWRRLAALHALRRRLPSSNADMFDVFRAGTLAEAVDRLVLATGWDRATVDALLGPRGFAVESPSSLRLSADGDDEPVLLRLAHAVDIQRRLGVTPDTLFAWVSAAPDAETAAAIVLAVKARYDEKRWLEVARSLNDPLRLDRREALVSYLLPRMREQGVHNRNQFFEYFLIDVEMMPCMLTSRIRQAIAAVQTFFQRSLMNLEPKVHPRLIDDDDWKWLKNYRVWEANRKIFLYPENWIEPELRDDKTPLFQELERSILQQEIKKENVEAAFSDYLQGLDEIARLDVRGVWFERRERKVPGGRPRPAGLGVPVPPDSPWDEGTYHIFARTFNAPHVWYYRRLEDGRTWTPWEKIDADIEGDHLVPVIFHRRMHLFWTVFRETNKPPPPMNKESKGPPPKLGKDWEIHLAYTVYDRQRWSRKRMSTTGVLDRQTLIHKDDEGIQAGGSRMLSPSDYTLRATISGDQDAGAGRSPARLSLSIYCRKMNSLVPILPPFTTAMSYADADVTLVGRFHLNGCNGALEPENAVAPGRVHVAPMHKSHRALKALVANPAVLASHPFTVASGGVLAAPSGYRVDGMGFSAARGSGPLLAVRPADARGTGLVLQAQRQSVSRARILPVIDPARMNDTGLFPFFFQDRFRSYFARPVFADFHPAKLVPMPLVGRHAVTAVPRPAAKKKRRRGWPGGRGRREDMESVFDPIPASEDDAFVEMDEQRGLPSDIDAFPDGAGDEDLRIACEAEDAWQDALDEAWHPDDAAEARRRSQGRRGRATPRASVPARAGSVPSPPAPRPPQIQFRRQEAFHEQRLQFTPFEQPSTCRLMSALKAGGIERLLEYSTTRPQRGIDHVLDPARGWRRTGVTWFQRHYQPGPLVFDKHFPSLDIEFGSDNPYAVYNWELFFHAPFQVAIRLAKDGRHEEAQRWFHFIFDPTTDASSPTPQRYWRFAPFHENNEYAGARELMNLLSYSGDDRDPVRRERQIRRQREVSDQIAAWWDKPFNPHVIARLRTVAYQKAVVMKYIDNLIEWGDKLFRRDTMESIHEATQLYILASNILGPRPEQIPPMVEHKPLTFQQMRDRLDLFSNFEVRVENSQIRRPFRLAARPEVGGVASVLSMATQYFCTPANPQLDKSWDAVADRLFKIRNCMNIQGVVRQLPLFEPPLDPGLLARAAAAGVDLGSVIAGLNAPPPQHRFRVLLGRALRLAEELRSFGAATLSVLERKDAEGLAALRASGETALQESGREIRKKQVRQVEEELGQLALEREHVEMKAQHLTTQLQELMSPQEAAAQQSLTAGQVISGIAEGVDLVSKVLHAIPDFQTGAAGGFSSPFATVQLGGQMFGEIASAFSESLQKVMNRNEAQADMAAAQAEYQRRREEWQHDLDLLGKEKAQIDKRISETQLKLEISNAELRRHDVEVDNARKVESYLRDKYTNAELYGWMLGQLSGTYFQAYKVAFDAARRAEHAYRFERGEPAASFIEFSYWDSLKKGLFAGERLLLDLRRMEAAHLESDQRALEITRHLSLAQDFPLSFAELAATGRCKVEITEALLDGDFPGHYFRRTKTVSLSAVGPVGTHSNLNCTLTLLENRIRIAANASGTYAQSEDGEDVRFLVNFAPVQAVATSRPTADAGVFELRFDGDHFLPFEGAGAVSTFRIELQQADNAVDLSQLRDVVLSLAYTARAGGAALEAAARAHREKGLARGEMKPLPQHRVSVRRDLPEVWKILAQAKPGQETEASLPLDVERLSGRFRGLDVRVERATLFAHARRPLAADALRLRLAGIPVTAWAPAWPGSHTLRASAEVAGKPGSWKFAVAATGGLLPELVDDLVLLFELRARKA
jgi:hypothetical protein